MAGGQSAASSQNQDGGYVTALPGIGATSPNPNMPGYPNMQGYPNSPGGQPGQPGLPTAPNGTPNAATQMISNMLSRPNPAGYAAYQRAQGLQPQPQQLQVGGSPGMTGPGVAGAIMGSGVMGGGNGIAGIASAAKLEGIMVYNDRTAYNEWEFIFDPAQVPRIPPPPGSSLGGAPANRIGTPAGQMSQTTGSAGGGSVGGAFGFGGAQQGPGNMAGGAAGMQIGGPAGTQMGQMNSPAGMQIGGPAGMQTGQMSGAAGMQMGFTGMGNTGLPANIRLGRP